MATLAGFDVEAVEDVKIAVDEMFSVVLDLGAGPPVDVTMTTLEDGRLEVVASTTAGLQPPPESTPGPMNRRVLSLIAEHDEVRVDEGVLTVRVVLSPMGMVDPG